MAVTVELKHQEWGRLRTEGSLNVVVGARRAAGLSAADQLGFSAHHKQLEVPKRENILFDDGRRRRRKPEWFETIERQRELQ